LAYGKNAKRIRAEILAAVDEADAFPCHGEGRNHQQQSMRDLAREVKATRRTAWGRSGRLAAESGLAEFSRGEYVIIDRVEDKQVDDSSCDTRQP